jgi:hypothetical protein
MNNKPQKFFKTICTGNSVPKKMIYGRVFQRRSKLHLSEDRGYNLK